MNPLRFQSAGLVVLSLPFAVRGFFYSDGAAWATAFVALLSAFALLGIDWYVDHNL